MYIRNHFTLSKIYFTINLIKNLLYLYVELVGDYLRTLNSIKNALGNFANSLVLNLLRFISRIIFVKVLSDVYLGVNGLLSNVLGILALAELGIGTAINYSLYKPLASNDVEECKSLMKFYKIAYRVIAIIVLVSGLILLPFLPWFIKDTSGIENLNIIYLIFLANMVIGYLFSYKRTLITADQKNYKITPYLIFSNFVMTVGQIIILLLFKNYILYLLVQTACVFLENILVNNYINKCYPYLKEINKANKLNKEDLTEIKTNIKALMLHKIGNYVLTATDNIVISKYIGIVAVGIYSNYVLIHSTVSNFIYTFVSNVTASFGNLIAEGDKKKRFDVFKEMDFITYCLYGVSTICLLFTLNPFIKLVFGSKYVLDFIVVLLIMINYYLVGINQVPIIVQSAAGVYKYDKYVPILEATLNLSLSIVLVKFLGLSGILLGTLISYLLPLIIKPAVIFKHVLDKEISIYFKSFFKQTTVLIISGLIIYLITNFIHVNSLMQVVINFSLSLIIPTLLIILIYKNTDEFQSAKNRFVFLFNKIRKRA